MLKYHIRKIMVLVAGLSMLTQLGGARVFGVWGVRMAGYGIICRVNGLSVTEFYLVAQSLVS